MKCKIIRDPQGQIDFVEAPNGAASKLYTDALSYTGDQAQALDLWIIPYTTAFKEVNGDWEQDISFTESLPEKSTGLNKNQAKETQNFFSSVVTGTNEKFIPTSEFVPDLSYTREEQSFNRLYSKRLGDFDNHIATSIPTFRETQVKKGNAIVKSYPNGALMYDIGGSEGTFAKAITEASDTSISTINLDPNEDMENSHNSTPVPNSTFVREAFFEGFDDIPVHIPESKADIVHESMVFQFVTPERSQFIDKIKDDYLKEDGLFITEEKLQNIDTDLYNRNEEFKNKNHKAKYFTAEQQAIKTEEVLVGMRQNQAFEHEYMFELKKRFKHVEVYWTSGNFKGIVASDNKTTIDRFMENLGGEITSVYSSLKSETFQEDGLQVDTNGEPTLESVLKFTKNHRASNQRLQDQDLDEIRNNLLDLPISTLEELSNVLNSTFYRDGKFVVERGSLQASNLYTMQEVEVILGNQSVQDRIKTIADRLSSQVLFEDTNLEQENSLVDTLFFSEDLLLSDYTEVIGIGKFKKVNPHEVDMTIKSIVAGNYTRQTFDDAVDTIPYESIRELYKNDKQFADDLFGRYSNFKNVLVLDSETLEPVPANDVQTRLEQSLVFPEQDNGVSDDINFLFSIPSDVWESSPEEVTTLLSQVEEKTIDYGIDVIGLSDQYDETSQNAILEFLATVGGLISSLNSTTTNENLISNFSNAYKEFFGIEEQNLQQPIELLDVSEREKNLVIVNTTRTELDLFTNESLVKVRDNIYQRVNKISDVDTLYGLLYDLAIFNPRILPEQAYYPTAFDTDNTLNLSKLSNTENRLDITNDIKRFIRSKMKEIPELLDIEFNGLEAESLVIYKYAFGHPVETLIPGVNMAEELNRYDAYKGDFDYLTSGFIADFYNAYLTEKLKDSELFENLFRHFDLNDTGIVLKNVDEYTKQGIRLHSSNTPLFRALKDYSLISRDPNLQDLYTVSKKDSIITDKFLRDFYANNPITLPLLNKDYNLSQDENVLAVVNVQENFIRTPEGVFEKVTASRNVSFYKRLPPLGNANFREYKSGISVSASNIDVSEFSDMIEDVGDTVNVTKLYSRKEETQIEQQLEDCA